MLSQLSYAPPNITNAKLSIAYEIIRVNGKVPLMRKKNKRNFTMPEQQTDLAEHFVRTGKMQSRHRQKEGMSFPISG